MMANCQHALHVKRREDPRNVQAPTTILPKEKREAMSPPWKLRSKRLERRVAQAKNQETSIDVLGMTSGAGLLTHNMPTSLGSRKQENQEANNVDDLVSDFGFLSVNATARDFHGFTGEMSFARLVLSMSSVEAIATDPSFSLPARYAVIPLIQHYIDNINVVYPFLSETLIFRSVDKVFGQGALCPTPGDYWITLMVLAVSHASQVRSYGDFHSQEALKCTAAALEHAEYVIRPGSRSGVQALLLLVLLALWVSLPFFFFLLYPYIKQSSITTSPNIKELGTKQAIQAPHHYNTWYLIGIAARAAVDLGLHQKPSYEFQSKMAGSNDEKLFTSVYSLDRLAERAS